MLHSNIAQFTEQQQGRKAVLSWSCGATGCELVVLRVVVSLVFFKPVALRRLLFRTLHASWMCPDFLEFVFTSSGVQPFVLSGTEGFGVCMQRRLTGRLGSQQKVS